MRQAQTFKAKRPIQQKRLDSTLITILIVVLVAFFMRFFVIDAAIVEGKSMLPHYKNGEVVLILRAAYGFRGLSGSYRVKWKKPSRGDVVAAISPLHQELVIKRIGEVHFDGISSWYFLIGDNAIESIDSRDFGPVPLDSILGKVIPQR